MNYNDQILENKAFNFFKQLMYNLALSICIMLVGVLIMVYGFKIGLYEVLSWSQEPYFTKGDMVIVQPQKSYRVGDIIKFDDNGTPTTHRLVAIIDNTYYICHGDNVQNLDDSEQNYSWEDDAAYINKLIGQGKTLNQIKADCGVLIQVVTIDKIEGTVINHLDNYGTYFKFVKEHALFVITIVAGIWCVCTVVQTELDIRKCRRLV